MQDTTETCDTPAGTDSERFAASLDHDGQRFETPEGTPLDALAERMCATAEIWRADIASPDHDAPDLFFAGRLRLIEDGPVVTGGLMSGDRIRYRFPDGSAIVVQGEGWDHEGDAPGTWCRA